MSVDGALREREAGGRPIRVGMVGAGATGRAIALELGTPVPGIRLVAIANRMPEHGERALREADATAWGPAGSVREAEAAIKRGLPALTDDLSVLTACDAIDLLVEVMGTVESHGSHSRRDKCVRADARLTAFVERESVIRSSRTREECSGVK